MYLYVPAATIFHQLHPVSKLLLLLFMIAIPFFAPGLIGIIVLFFCYLALLMAAHGFGNLKKMAKLMVLFWIGTFLIWIIIPYLRHSPWSYTGSALLATRIVSFVLAGLTFGTITRVEEFTYGLTRLKIPYKGAFALTLGFRLVPLFYQNLQTIVEAQKSRGVDLDNASLFRKAGLYLPVISILISYGLRNADIMAMALEAKGFGYSPQRTFYMHPAFGFLDIAILIIASGIIVGLYLLH
ncbi:energy-coupling factor transporter transmembrane protein EcfT, partial [bacterium]|nr:energy-coupling factor transporter transmembrane protein EcfT [bacterium]